MERNDVQILHTKYKIVYMKQSRIISLIFLLPILLTLSQVSAQKVSESKRTKPLNILLIVSEDNGAELGCYGVPVKTPNLDKLAAEGVLYKNAYVTQAGCSPSRSSILTGLYTHQNGQVGLATWKYSMYNPRTPNIISSLKAGGYRTGMIGKIHVNPESAFDLDYHEVNGGNFKRKDLDDYASMALRFITASDKPFYLQVNYPDAHRPFLTQANGRPEKPLSGKDVEPLPFFGLSSDSLKQITADYYNCIMRLDSYVGDLIEQLKASGKYENTLIVYLGDHGQDIIRGKRTSYEGGLRIPLIMSAPGARSGRKYEHLVSTIDLFPTFMEIAGLPVPSHLPGKSLKTILNGSDQPVRSLLFAEFNTHSNHEPYPQRSVRDNRYKLIYNPCFGTENPGLDYTVTKLVSRNIFNDALSRATPEVKQAYTLMRTPPEFELYDLQKDPYEMNNLSNNSEYRDIVNKLKEQLTNWQKETRDPFIDKAVAKRFFKDVMNAGSKKGFEYHSYMDPKYSFK